MNFWEKFFFFKMAAVHFGLALLRQAVNLNVSSGPIYCGDPSVFPSLTTLLQLLSDKQSQLVPAVFS